METSMISISTASIMSADPDLRDAILNLAGLTELKGHSRTGFGVLSTTDSPLEIDADEAIQFLETCSPKTKKVLQGIVERDGEFDYGELEEAMAIGPLKGVWTGLTRRTRSLTASSTASLIDWVWNEEQEAYDGRMAPETVDAFRRAF